jgi:CubicO group peptidase (beta-lactamase class C family)
MLMQGFPPPPQARVTLANWQDPPYNRWAFSHLREIVPTQRISRGRRGEIMPLPADPQPLGDVATAARDGSVSTVEAVLDATYTDGVVVVHGGRTVFERYAGETHPDTPHLLMSVTKSFVGCVVGNLVDRGVLSTEQLVTDHVPELLDSGYRGARVCDLLDMRSGIKFSENYTDLDAEVRVFEQAALWRPATHGVPLGIYAYLTTLVAAREHGGIFEYRSCETDVLGWVCERASGTRMADLIADLVWTPMGAEYDAEISCDGLGAAMHDGGMSATTADLARFGVMLLAGGEAGGNRVVPAEWLAASWNPDPDVRNAFAGSFDAPYLPGGWYHNQFWFLPRPQGDVLLCLGINGQMLYVDPATGTVAAKTSSWPEAQSPTMLYDTINAFDAVAAVLAGHPLEITPRRPGPPGVAAGLSRHRSSTT